MTSNKRQESSIEKNLPEGMRFYLPPQSEVMTDLARRGSQALKEWGYRPIYVPALIPYDTIVGGLGGESVKDCYKLVDYRGEILVLRPEMTAAIAEKLACENDREDLYGRYQYFAPVYRHESTQSGKKREIYQLGAEFLGESRYADIEILLLAQEILLSCGVSDFKVEIGHVGYFDQLISEFGLSQQEEAGLKSSLASRNLVQYRNLCQSLTDDIGERLLRLLDLRGDIEILQRAENLLSSSTSRPLDQLREIYSGLKDIGYAERISFDLGLTRDLNYYSGLVFEIMSPQLGYNICGGGRYDRLLEKMGGKRVAARGFALGIERLRLIREKQNPDGSGDNKASIYFASSELMQPAVQLARRLHEQNLTTRLKNEAIIDDIQIESSQEISIVVKDGENDGENSIVYDLRIKDRLETELKETEVIKIAAEYAESSSAQGQII